MCERHLTVVLGLLVLLHHLTWRISDMTTWVYAHIFGCSLLDSVEQLGWVEMTSDTLKKRFEFPSSFIQSQVKEPPPESVNNLILAPLCLFLSEKVFVYDHDHNYNRCNRAENRNLLIWWMFCNIVFIERRGINIKSRCYHKSYHVAQSLLIPSSWFHYLSTVIITQ